LKPAPWAIPFLEAVIRQPCTIERHLKQLEACLVVKQKD